MTHCVYCSETRDLQLCYLRRVKTGFEWTTVVCHRHYPDVVASVLHARTVVLVAASGFSQR